MTFGKKRTYLLELKKMIFITSFLLLLQCLFYSCLYISTYTTFSIGFISALQVYYSTDIEKIIQTTIKHPKAKNFFKPDEKNSLVFLSIYEYIFSQSTFFISSEGVLRPIHKNTYNDHLKSTLFNPEFEKK